MIRELRIAGLGVIDGATLELGPGLTVLTGETGAGKTMVLTALGLLRGDKADAGVVRTGTAKAEVEGRFAIGLDAAVVTRLDEAGGELDGDELIIGRTLTAEGRSRAFAGGRSVPVSFLTETADELVAVHGQGDQTRLTRPSAQRAALDRFAGATHLALLVEHRGLLAELRRVEHELSDLVEAARERTRERELLEFGVAEITAAQPQPNELEQLATEASRLTHSEVLRDTVDAARMSLSGDDPDVADVLGLLAQTVKRLQRAQEFDTSMAAFAARAQEVGALAADLAADLATYVDGVTTDPARLAAAEDRRAELTRLVRKYGESLDDVVAWLASGQERLLALAGDDERVPQLQAQRAQLQAAVAATATTLHEGRLAAAKTFAAAVTAELTDLAMPNAVLEVAVVATHSAKGAADSCDVVLSDAGAGAFRLGPDGVDDVELLLRPHSGAEARPIAKAASGGELSRVMLALEVVLAGSDSVPTFVFDEVDAGVGGRAATEVGRRLAALAHSAQVIVVTHLPQVAAFADVHVLVEKSDDGTTTSTSVTVLDDTARQRELARMLAGLESSAAAVKHAEELLGLAADFRALSS